VSPSRVPHILRPARLALAALALAIPAAPASAGTVSIKLSDPAADSTGGSTTELSGATIVQDTTKGTITATVAFGAAPKAGASVAIGLGKTKSGACSIGTEGDGSLVFLLVLDAPPTGLWALDGDPTPHTITPSLSGTTLKVTSGAASSLKKFSWDCANVAIQTAGEGEGDAVGDSMAGSGTGAGGPQVVVLTDKPDGDKDGVPDVADACPAVAGSSANGCLELAEKLALRLGAKRIAVNMMVPRTGASCAAVAKATVKQGSKTLGKGTLAVGVHGSFCHISGAVKIKKHGKKVKVKIAGSGFKTISKTIKK
jgi:hypothetical protein